MLLKEIIDIIESLAPLSAQEKWDNSGLQIGHLDDDVTSVLLCTDVTECVVQEAVAKGAQLILSHHPLLFHGLKKIAGETPQQRITEMAIRSGIAVYSSHTAIDVQLNGVSGHAVELLGIRDYIVLAPTCGENGLGVIGDLSESLTLNEFLNHLSAVFHQPFIRYSNPTDKTIKRVAFVGGGRSRIYR